MLHLDDASWHLPAYQVIFTRQISQDFCVVIPVLNEGSRIVNQLRQMMALGLDKIVDIFIADGGSTDGSTAPAILTELGVHTLLVKQGPGKLGAQLRMAYGHCLRAGYRGIVTIDGNNKDGVEAIPAFLTALSTGSDFVQGSRFIAGGKAIRTPWSRWWAIRLIHAPLLGWASGFNWTDTTSGFRGYSRRLLLDPRVAPFRDVFSSYELLFHLSAKAPQLGFSCQELPVSRAYPATGKVPTKISPLRGNLGVLWALWRTIRGDFNPAVTDVT